MGEETTATLFEQIESEFETLKENHANFQEKGNKAAGKRARKAANELKKLMTPYKQTSVNEAKQL